MSRVGIAASTALLAAFVLDARTISTLMISVQAIARSDVDVAEVASVVWNFHRLEQIINKLFAYEYGT